MAPSLEHYFTLRGYFDFSNSIDMKNVKGGPQRMVIPINSGFIRGNGLDAEIVPGGADCLLWDHENNVVHLDVRLNARTKNGHGMFIHYDGVLRIDDLCQGPISGASDAQSTKYGDHEWFSAPILETSDPEFKWVESAFFAGEGRWVVDEGRFAIEYEVYRLRPSR